MNKNPDSPAQIRLHKIIAKSGILSLRAAEKAIAEGRVEVNGVTVTKMGAVADPATDKITLDGQRIKTPDAPVYLMMYKPTGYVTTRSDEEDRRTVMDLLPAEFSRLFPVGRLDIMSEGLLLFTNDGDFSQAILAPRNKIERVYQVKVRNIPDKKILEKMVSGITVDGEKLKVMTAKLVSSTKTNARLELVLTEGKKRHIRRLCQILGIPAMKIKRVAFGPLKLGNLKPGEMIHVPVEKVNAIKKLAARTGGKKK
ncbi:MAG: rRNA pseudouridine synthase [Nitrospinota bacterium]|nr:rRNA pseudouridine synthase [Nitrospinota bacterium]MDH5757757.1 rRNA pseudouridine synthase [Nitrospinota bacterium]